MEELDSDLTKNKFFSKSFESRFFDIRLFGELLNKDLEESSLKKKLFKSYRSGIFRFLVQIFQKLTLLLKKGINFVKRIIFIKLLFKFSNRVMVLLYKSFLYYFMSNRKEFRCI